MSTPSIRRKGRLLPAIVAAVALAASLVSCGGGHHLAEYPFASRTLAVVYIAPPAPELLTSYYDLTNSQNPVEAVVRAGAAEDSQTISAYVIGKVTTRLCRSETPICG